MRGWIVGLMAAVLVAIGLAVAAVVLLSPGDDTLVLDLDSGDCFEVPDDIADATIAEVDTIDCAKPHEAEVFATGELEPGSRSALSGRRAATVRARRPAVRGRSRRPS